MFVTFSNMYLVYKTSWQNCSETKAMSSTCYTLVCQETVIRIANILVYNLLMQLTIKMVNNWWSKENV